jgi:hypothetical protein
MSRVYSIIPRFRLDRATDFIVIGKGFDKDGGTHFKVDLTSADDFTWDTNTQDVIDANRIVVNATPHSPDEATGIGDLTVVVTNGDGTVSNTQSLDVSYEPEDA